MTSCMSRGACFEFNQITVANGQHINLAVIFSTSCSVPPILGFSMVDVAA